MNLMEQMDTMTWRRFMTLTRNLSPGSATAARAAREAVREQEAGQRQAAAFFEEMTPWGR